MMNRILALVICIVFICGAFASYWLYRFTKIRYEPVARDDEEAEYIADCRNNITKQVSAAFCALHHRSLEDDEENGVNIIYQAIGYTSNLMIVTIENHWLKAYFDWHSHKIRLEYYIGDDQTHTYRMRFDRMGFINTGKLLKVWYKHFVPRFEAEKYPLERLLKLARDAGASMWDKVEYEGLLKELLEEYAEQVNSMDDVGVYCALVNVLAKDEKAREVIEKMLPQIEDSSEEETE